MLDVIICANFGVEKLRGLQNMRGQSLEFPIEMAGHPYNRAGATAQPVMSRCNETKDFVSCDHLLCSFFVMYNVYSTQEGGEGKQIV